MRGGMRAGLCLAAASRVRPRLAFRWLPEQAAGVGAVGAGLADPRALDLGRRTAGQLGQGVQDLEDVAQLLDQVGRAGGGGFLGFFQELGSQPEGVLGLGRRLVEGAGLVVGGGQLGDAVADQLHDASPPCMEAGPVGRPGRLQRMRSASPAAWRAAT